MGEVYIFERNETDFTTTGLVGALCPSSVTHTEIAGGMSSVEIEHPYDPWGKWQAIEAGRIIQCVTRVRTPPVLDGTTYVTTVEKWSVRNGLTKTQKKVYAKNKGSSTTGTLVEGREIYVLQTGTERTYVRYEKVKSKKAGTYVWANGWVDPDVLNSWIEDVPSPEGQLYAETGDAVSKPQLFRIKQVVKDLTKNAITVYAQHITYDLLDVVTHGISDEPCTAEQALNATGWKSSSASIEFGPPFGIMFYDDFYYTPGDTPSQASTTLPFIAKTNIGSSRAYFDFDGRNVIDALLNDKDGFLTRWNAELIRDNYTLYFLIRAGRDTGVRIERGGTITGAVYTFDESDVITAVLPYGHDEYGKKLYLSSWAEDHPGDNGMISLPPPMPPLESYYVLSPNVDNYPYKRCMTLECQDCDVGGDITKEIARVRMREQAEAQFAETNPDRVDVPKYTLKVKFVETGTWDGVERYRDLENVFLYDTVSVVDKTRGIDVTATVRQIKFDCLAERLIEVQLDGANVRVLAGRLYSSDSYLMADSGGNEIALPDDYHSTHTANAINTFVSEVND